MPGYHLIASVLFEPQRDRGDNPPLPDALYKLLHVLIHLYMEGMVWEIVDLRQWDVMDFGKPVFHPTPVIHE